jgi:hypothetical protein
MKTKIVAGVFVIIFGIISCHKENYSSVYTSSGVITGPDIRACVCCGGWFIKIDTLTYEFNNLPEGSSINLETETFPLSVKLNWQPAVTGACTANRIVITKIKKEQP